MCLAPTLKVFVSGDIIILFVAAILILYNNYVGLGDWKLVVVGWFVYRLFSQHIISPSILIEIFRLI